MEENETHRPRQMASQENIHSYPPEPTTGCSREDSIGPTMSFPITAYSMTHLKLP